MCSSHSEQEAQPMTTADKLRRITTLERQRKPAMYSPLEIILVGIEPVTMAEVCRVPLPSCRENNVSSR